MLLDRRILLVTIVDMNASTLRGAAVALASTLLASHPAGAYTEAEIAAATAVAGQVAQLEQEVGFMAGDALEGRNNNTPESFSVQSFLSDQLLLLAAEALDGSATPDGFLQPFTLGGNVLGVIRGRELPNEYVIVGAHYDHFGPFQCSMLSLDDDICNGATDNATGVAAVLGIGKALRALPEPPRRSVVLAFWDREEDGLLGSAHYIANPLVPLASTVAYVNFDIQGANLLPSLREISFAVGAETGGQALVDATRDAIVEQNLDTGLFSLVFGQGRSDHANPRLLPALHPGGQSGGTLPLRARDRARP